MSNGKLTPQGGAVGGVFLRQGEVLRDWDTGVVHVVMRVVNPRTFKPEYFLAPMADGGQAAPRSQWKSPSGVWVNELGKAINVSGRGEITDDRALPQELWLGGGGGTGSAAPQWRPGELDLERQQLQANIAATEQRLEEIRMQEASADERQRLQLQAEREMLVMRLENDRRTLVYGEYGATARQKMANQQSAREMKFGLREDPFALGAAMTGMPMLAGTPTQQYRGELTDFINQPIPQMSINAPIPQMEAALQNLGGGQMPMPQSTFGLPGMAEGGRIEMEKGGDGAFSMKQSRLVGEGKRGEGIKNKTAEIMTVERGPFGIKSVEITPFAGAAATGLTPEQERWGYVQQLAPLWKDLAPGGAPGHMQTAGRLAKFGYSPSLVKVGNQYWIKAPTGEYRYIDPGIIAGKGQYSGLPSAASAQTLGSIGEMNAMGGIGAALRPDTLQDFLYSLSRPNLTGTAGAMSAPITTNVFGLPMPALHKAAGTLSRMFADPLSSSTFAPPILSAYQNAMIGGVPAGISPDALRNIVGSYTPQAGAFGGRRIGFSGGYM